jgi:hypothetical protein
MSTKLVFPCALVLAVVGIRGAHAQDLLPPPTRAEAMAGPPSAAVDATAPVAASPTPMLSSWMTYPRLDCCGPIGGDGPVRMELFARTGPSLPAEGAILGHVLETGWKIEAGGRSLFFNPAMDAAWNIDLSLSNTRYQGQRSDVTIPIVVITTNPTTGALSQQVRQVTLRNLNMTDVNVAFGREWYLRVPANVCDTRWRAGIDGGARIGTDKAELHELQHRTSTGYAMSVAAHTDLEVPCGCCTFLAGLRTEWAYDWSHILQSSNASEMQEVNFLMTFGVRY